MLNTHLFAETCNMRCETKKSIKVTCCFCHYLTLFQKASVYSKARITCSNFSTERHSFNRFHGIALFLYLLKGLRNQKFSDRFRGDRKKSIAWNDLPWYWMYWKSRIKTSERPQWHHADVSIVRRILCVRCSRLIYTVLLSTSDVYLPSEKLVSFYYFEHALTCFEKDSTGIDKSVS